MFPKVMFRSNSITDFANNVSSSRRNHADFGGLSQMVQNPIANEQPPKKMKKKRNLPGNPDPDAEVIALSPKSLMATNRFVCEICNKGFQRDQNLQLHRRGHNLPWKLKQTKNKENKKRVYVCPEPTCVHNDPTRALGDLTGIKKHYCRKHGVKKWKCEKCTKIYAVKSDWKAHSKICGMKEYKCDCGSMFSRKDSFTTHKAFCDAVAKDNGNSSNNVTHSMVPSSSLLAPNPTNINRTATNPQLLLNQPLLPPMTASFAQYSAFNRCFPNQSLDPLMFQNPKPNPNLQAHNIVHVKREPFYQERGVLMSSSSLLPPLSATALLQKAMGSVSPSMNHHVDMRLPTTWHEDTDGMTRDFLGLASEQCGDVAGLTGAAGFSQLYDHRDGSFFGV